MLSDLFILPLFWLLAFFYTMCVGIVFMPFKKEPGVLSNNPFTYFWFGLGVMIGFLQLWNLILPVSVYCWLVLLPFAVYGAIMLVKGNIPLEKVRQRSTLTTILGIAVLIFLVLSSLNNKFIYDTRVYHFYSIKWFNNYPVTPGMGNVLVYLAFNHSYFLYAAFLNGLWGHYKGACATNGLLVIAICAEIIILNTRVLVRKEKLTFHAIFQLLFLPLCINAGTQMLSSPTPDVFNNLIAFRVISDLILCIESKKPRFQDIFIIAFYAFYGIAMKLSAISIALGTLLVLVLIVRKRKLWSYRNFLVTAAFAGVIIIPYLIRSVISSGYLLFPSSAIGFPVDWKVPSRIMIDNYDYTVGFARTLKHGAEATAAAHNYRWIKDWAVQMLHRFGFFVPFLVCFGCFLLLRIKKINTSPLLFIYLPLAIALTFWFFTAPDIRFATFILWSVGLIALAWLLSHLQGRWTRVIPTIILVCSCIVMIRNWNTDLAQLGDLPHQSTDVFVTKTGLKVYKVKEIRGNDIYTLNDCTIPCSFQLDSNLMMRGKTIKDGFRISPQK